MIESERKNLCDTMSRDAFEQCLIQFIAGPLAERRGLQLGDTVLDATTPLFKSGLIDSMGILDLLAFVEATTERTIPTHKVDMQYFGNVAAITKTFWHAGIPT